MSGNGGGRKPHKFSKSVKRQKELGVAASRAILANNTKVEKFLEKLRNGKLSPYEYLGYVIKQYGLEFDVDVNGVVVRATLSGMLTGPVGVLRNPAASTAVRAGSWVVVEDLGLGHMARGTHHQIMAVMDVGQAATARRLLGIRNAPAAVEENMPGFMFNYGTAEEDAAAARAAELAQIALVLSARGRTKGLARYAAEAANAAAELAAPVEVTVLEAPENTNVNALAAANAAAAKSAKASARFQRRKATRKAKKEAAAGGGGSGR